MVIIMIIFVIVKRILKYIVLNFDIYVKKRNNFIFSGELVRFFFYLNFFIS